MPKLNGHPYCNNCARIGHSYHQCRAPITSFGIIAYRYSNGQLEYLVIRRKDSLGFVDFVRGKYKSSDKVYLQNIIHEMTTKEKVLLVTKPFSELWRYLWMCGPQSYPRLEEKSASQKKHVLADGITNGTESFNLASLVDSSTSNWSEPEWGFPKGRRNFHEKELECAIREFNEETGYNLTRSGVLTSVRPFIEIFTGSNFKSYKHVYYVAKLDICARSIGVQKSEVGDMQWLGFEDVVKIIRPYNLEKIDVITRVNKMLNEYSICA